MLIIWFGMGLIDWFLIWVDLVRLILKVAGNRLDSFRCTGLLDHFGLAFGYYG